MAGVQFMRLGQAKIVAQEIGHGTVADQLRCSSTHCRCDQPIGHQNLENLVPARPLSARRQAVGLEPVQLQLAPPLTRQPARPPLPRPVSLSADRQRRTTEASSATAAQRSSGNSASVRGSPDAVSNTSIA